MRTKNKGVFIIVPFFLAIALYSIYGNCSDPLSINGRDWKLTIHSLHTDLKDLPAVGGLTSIRVPDNKEGVEIIGEIEPSRENDRLVIELKDFKLLVGSKEFFPAGADIVRKSKNDMEVIDSHSGYHSSALNEKDFPAKISIQFLVDKNPQKLLFIKGSSQVPLPYAK